VDRSSVLFVGGRSGVGKSSAASALHELLAERSVRHAVIEGDTLDLAWPSPWQHGDDMAGRNLAAVWGNYRSAGFRRLV
jgi:ABC-type glutathione transport system ATPase component